MAIPVEITIDSFETVLTAATITVPTRFHTSTNMQLQSLSVVLDQSGLNPSNWVSSYKAAAISALLSGYGLSFTANDLMVYGAPQ